MGYGVSAARRTARAAAQSFGVELEFGDGAAESIAVHAQLAGRLALVALAVLQHGENELLLEFADGFGISDAALVHLHDQSFQLIFHDASLFTSILNQLCPRDSDYVTTPCRFRRCSIGMCSGTVRSRFHPSQKRCRNSAGAAQTRRGWSPAETARSAIAAVPIAERMPPAPARSPR